MMILIFGAGLVVLTILAVFLRDLLKAAISLAAASICLAIIFFILRSPYAAVFEISVVAGLIMVLFISAIVLTRNVCDDSSNTKALRIFPVALVLFVALDIWLAGRFAATFCGLPGQPPAATFGQALWRERTMDLVGQIGVILAGVAVVMALFRSGDKHE